MKDDDGNNNTQSFIVRIWNDADLETGKIKAWRGSIVHVGHGSRFYFYNLNSIPDFIRKQTGMGSERFDAWFKAILDRVRGR